MYDTLGAVYGGRVQSRIDLFSRVGSLQLVCAFCKFHLDESIYHPKPGIVVNPFSTEFYREPTLGLHIGYVFTSFPIYSFNGGIKCSPELMVCVSVDVCTQCSGPGQFLPQDSQV